MENLTESPETVVDAMESLAGAILKFEAMAQKNREWRDMALTGIGCDLCRPGLKCVWHDRGQT